MHELIVLKEQGWCALSTGAEAANALYNAILADEAVIVFPCSILLEW
jgi:hypothetical protein